MINLNIDVHVHVQNNEDASSDRGISNNVSSKIENDNKLLHLIVQIIWDIINDNKTLLLICILERFYSK
jgi:hypothetical protein